MERGARSVTSTLNILPKYYANACQKMDLKIPGYSDYEHGEIKFSKNTYKKLKLLG